MSQARHRNRAEPNWLFQIFWTVIGLSLTVLSTFVEASRINAPWSWFTAGIRPESLGFYGQLFAVLLIGCVAGKRAGMAAQLGYIIIGLFWLPVFTQGGDLTYLREPAFGYILGFIPAAGICGWLAFRYQLSLESLAWSAFCGLLTLHGFGITYLIVRTGVMGSELPGSTLAQAIARYTFSPFPNQLFIVCGVAVTAFGLQRILLYKD